MAKHRFKLSPFQRHHAKIKCAEHKKFCIPFLSRSGHNWKLFCFSGIKAFVEQ